MPQVTLTQKLQRIVAFLVGARFPEIYERMHRRGFELSDWEEGWSLVHQAAAANALVVEHTADTTLVALVELERRSIPIIDATLQARFPALHQRVFAGYQRVSGPGVIVMMKLVSDRLGALMASEGTDEQQATALLAHRGVTGETITAIEAALAQAVSLPAIGEAPASPNDERSRAQDAMWRWFLEWSRIARAEISDRRSLRRLGFLRNRTGASSADASEGDDGSGAGTHLALPMASPALPAMGSVQPVRVLASMSAPASTPAPA